MLVLMICLKFIFGHCAEEIFVMAGRRCREHVDQRTAISYFIPEPQHYILSNNHAHYTFTCTSSQIR